MWQSKKEILIGLIKKSEFKKALRIAKDFIIEFTKDEQRTLQIAYECLTGNERTYKMLNIDTEVITLEAKNLLMNYAKTQ
jgi:hypothetical protein